MAKPDFLETFFFVPKIGKIDQKWAKNGFFEFIEKFGR